MTQPTVIGLGSDHGDDQAGWLVVKALRQHGYPNELLIQSGHPTDLLDVFEGKQHLVICDACDGNGTPGKVHHLRWPADEFSDRRASGSHDLSLCDVLELGRRLDCCPNTVEIWAVEGRSWTSCTSPSDEVQIAANIVAGVILGQFQNAERGS